MRIWGRTIGIIILLLAIGCAGPGGVSQKQIATLTPLAGSTLSGITLDQRGDSLDLLVDEVAAEGLFLRINLPGPGSISSEDWQGVDDLLYLAAPTAEGIEIGLVPLKDYPGDPVTLNLVIDESARTVRNAPLDPRNMVDDLQVEFVEDGTYRLSWTEKNIGDYNANGEVGVSDLTPLGVYFDQQVSEGAPAWVDGDGNGRITVADLTPIGQNYADRVAGYVVWQNDVSLQAPDGGTVTALRPDTTAVAGPPVYSIELPGEGGDTWHVTPVDIDYPASAPGINSNEVQTDPVIPDPDLLVFTEITGLELLDISNDQRSIFNDGHRILRIIDPGDIVDNIEFGERLLVDEIGQIVFVADGDASVSGLPREVPLILEVIFAPSADLANGIPWFNVTNPPSDSQFVVAAVPFMLPADDSNPTELDVDVTLVPKLDIGTGYQVEAVITDKDDIEHIDYTQRRLDFNAALVSQLTAPGHTFDQEVKMLDTDRDGISDSLLQSAKDAVVYGAAYAVDLLLSGTIDGAFVEGSGELALKNVVLYIDETEVLVSNYTVYYNESTRFGMVQPDGKLDDPDPIDPSILKAEDIVKLKCYIYKDGQGPTDRIWAETVGLY